VHIAALLADFFDGVQIVETDSVEQQVCLEAIGIALVAQAHWLEVAELDECTLVAATMGAENVATMPAMVLRRHCHVRIRMIRTWFPNSVHPRQHVMTHPFPKTESFHTTRMHRTIAGDRSTVPCEQPR
jgi:hypothetical protein